jgi:hypothetical protein
LEVQLEVSQLDGEAFFIGLASQAGAELAVDVHTGPDHDMGKVSFIHGLKVARSFRGCL